MNILYNQIINDINNIKNNKNSNDIKSLLQLSLSESRIKSLIIKINNYYNENHPNDIIPSLSFKDLNDFESKLNDIENIFGEEASNNIVKELNKTNKPDLTFLDNEIEQKYMFFAKLDQTVRETINIHYQNILDDENPNELPKDLILAYQNESKNLIKDINPDNNIDHEYYFILDFVKKPASFFVNRNKNVFKFNSNKEMNEFIKDIDNEIAVRDLSKNGIRIENEYLNKLHSYGKYNSEDLAQNLYKIIKEYSEYLKEIEEPEIEESPKLGRLLYDLKDKLTNIVITDDVELGPDKHSVFIKKYLDNPIKALSDYQDEEINKNIKNQEIANQELDFKNEILNEKKNYDICTKGKVDAWKVQQEYKKKWFINHFNVEMKNSTIKEVLENNKGGFFENLFGTTSQEFKDFAKALSEMIKDGPGKGDLDGLRRLAEIYISHKIEYDPFIKGYDEQEINELDSTGRGRVRLCLSVIEAIDNAKESVEEKLNPEDFKHVEYDSPLMHNEYWEPRLINDEDFLKNLKSDSDLDNDKFNDAILDIDSDELDNNIDMHNSK